MKKLAIICLLLASLHARADVVIAEDVQTTTPDKSAAGSHTDEIKNIIIKLKDGKIREDVPMFNIVSIIIDPAADALIGFAQNERNEFMRQSLNVVKAQVAGIMKIEASRHGVPPDYKDTGKQEKIGGYNAEIYTLEWRGMKCTAWISKEVPDYAAIRDQLKLLDLVQGCAGWSPYGDFGVPDTSKVGGVPVKFAAVTARGRIVTWTIVSVKQQPLDVADFKIPAGYIEMTPPRGAAQTASTGPGSAAPAQ